MIALHDSQVEQKIQEEYRTTLHDKMATPGWVIYDNYCYHERRDLLSDRPNKSILYKKDRDVGDKRRIAQVRRHNEGSKKDCGDSARDGKKISKVWPICGRKFELSHSGSNQ